MQGYSPPNEPASEYQTIPLSKIEDFGVHAKHYYSLDVTFFKSSMDEHLLGLLWNKYWVNTLSSSPLVNTRDLTSGQISDIGELILLSPRIWLNSACSIPSKPYQKCRSYPVLRAVGPAHAQNTNLRVGQIFGLCAYFLLFLFLFRCVAPAEWNVPILL